MIKEKFLALVAVSSAIIAMIAPSALASDYYINYETGDDSLSGTSQEQAWKHHPDDQNASLISASTTAQPGDNFFFAGGVVYRGWISISGSGESDNPISLIGNQWGQEKAIIDGSVPIESPIWTACESAEDCLGNPNWENIYYTVMPDAVSSPFQFLLYDNGSKKFSAAQHPNISDTTIIDYLEDWQTITPANISATSLTEPAGFNSTAPAAFDDAWVGVWVTGNRVNWSKITSYDPQSKTIQMNQTGNAPYADRDSYYTIIGAVSNLDTEGEYAYSTANNRLYIYPSEGTNPNNLAFSASTLSTGIYGNNKGNITISGFEFRGQFGAPDGGAGSGVAINLTGANLSSHNTVEDCYIHNIRSLNKYYMISLPAAENNLINSNRLENIYGGGTVIGSNTTVSNNSYFNMARTVIYAQGAINCVITRNTIERVLGVHANGISTYDGCENIEVSFNKVINAPSLITYLNSKDLRFIGNFIDANNQDQRVNDWGGCSGTIEWINNTFVNCSSGNSLLFASKDPELTYIIRNNILEGGGVLSDTPFTLIASNNIFTNLAWFQSPKYNWTPGTDSSIEDPNDIYINPSQGNFNLKLESPALNSGFDVTAYNINTDINNSQRPLGGFYDIGAYEFDVTNLIPLDPDQLRKD